VKPILIAGIGNIFLGDDAFGCEVVRQLSFRKLPEHARVIDFGIRSYDLACALTDDYQAVILVDAASRGEMPGTTFLLEIEDSDLKRLNHSTTFDAHSMNPVCAIQMAQSLGDIRAKMFLVGCEPTVSKDTTGEMGLSQEVSQAIPGALKLIDSLLEKLTKHEPGSETQTEPVARDPGDPALRDGDSHVGAELELCAPGAPANLDRL